MVQEEYEREALSKHALDIYIYNILKRNNEPIPYDLAGRIASLDVSGIPVNLDDEGHRNKALVLYAGMTDDLSLDN